MRAFNWNGQNGSENTAADSLGPRKALGRRKILKVVKRSALRKARSVPLFDTRRPLQRRWSNEGGCHSLATSNSSRRSQTKTEANGISRVTGPNNLTSLQREMAPASNSSPHGWVNSNCLIAVQRDLPDPSVFSIEEIKPNNFAASARTFQRCRPRFRLCSHNINDAGLKRFRLFVYTTKRYFCQKSARIRNQKCLRHTLILRKIFGPPRGMQRLEEMRDSLARF